tara:strand:- start:367 stop:522 length:156 start_codon:yes stop_codon:yes gene_type:complete
MGKKDSFITNRKRSQQKKKEKFEKFGKCTSKHVREYENLLLKKKLIKKENK